LKEAQEKLRAEIRTLERELRDELPKALGKALEMGDLRENAEYQTAKERQSYVQGKYMICIYREPTYREPTGKLIGNVRIASS